MGDPLITGLGKDAPPAEAPVVLIGRSGSKRLVLAANDAARGLGIYPGAAAARAQAMAADLIIQDADLAGDQDGLEKLALWALKSFSPVVAADLPDGLVIDATGASHLKGGEGAYVKDLTRRLAKVGVVARAAVSGSWGSAHALARYIANPTVVVDSADSGRAIAGLPIRALRLPGDMVDGLSKLGFDVVGELEASARAPLVHRFGPELMRRLDQAYGRVSEPIEPVEAPELVQVRRAFAPEPIAAPETLARYTVKLVEALCAVLEERGLGVRVAASELERLNEMLLNDSPLHASMAVGAYSWSWNPDSPTGYNRHATVVAIGAAFGVATCEAQAFANGQPIMPVRSQGYRAKLLAKRNPHFEAAVSLYATAGTDLRRLWLPFEYIEKRGKLDAWAAKHELRSFRATANEGQHQRHIGKPWAPNKPAIMSPDDARAFVRRLLVKWLDTEEPA